MNISRALAEFVANTDYDDIPAYVIRRDGVRELRLSIAEMTPDEKDIVRAGCLINFNRSRKARPAD